MIEINDIVKQGDIYLIKYFADGIKLEMETPVSERQLLCFIIEESLNIWEDNSGKQKYADPAIALSENLESICKLYVSQQPDVTMTISGKLFDRYVEYIKRNMRTKIKLVRHTTPEPNRKMYIEAIISDAKSLELDLDFIEELKSERV